MDAARIPAFADALQAAWGERKAVVEPLVIEGRCSVEGVTAEAVHALASLGPFGSGNAEPLFEIVGRIASLSAVGASGAHIRLALEGEGGGRLEAIAYRAGETALGRGLAAARGSVVRAVGALRPDRFRGEGAVALRLVDAALS
ncbi:MAG: hypothetical protein RML45_04340 [Acetobacteraceae bacterium]|nr:hypothetical protein [Acetobacteraceae bacterium]